MKFTRKFLDGYLTYENGDIGSSIKEGDGVITRIFKIIGDTFYGLFIGLLSFFLIGGGILLAIWLLGLLLKGCA